MSLFEQGPMSTVEPRYNKPLYNKVLRVQNDILDPSNSNIRCIWKRTLISQNFIIFNIFCQSLGPLLFSSSTVQLAHICDNERDRRRCTDSLSLYSDIDNIWFGDSGPRKLPLSLLTRVHIERVNFKENIWAFFLCRDEEIKSDEHVKAMRGNFFKNDKLTNLKLMVFLILHRSWAIFQKSVKNNWNWWVWFIAKSLTIFVPSVVESQRRCCSKFHDHTWDK